MLVLAMSMPFSAAAQESPVGLLPDAVAPPDTVAQPVVAAPPAKPTIVPQTLNLGLSLFEAYDLTTVTDGLPGLAADPRRGRTRRSPARMRRWRMRRPAGFIAERGRRQQFPLLLICADGAAGQLLRRRQRVDEIPAAVRVQRESERGLFPVLFFGTALTPTNATQIFLPQGDENIALLKTYTADSSASLAWTINRRASFSTSYNFDYVYTPESLYRVRNQGASALFQYQTTRYLAMRFGYGYSRSSVGSTAIPSFDAHDINIGVATAGRCRFRATRSSQAMWARPYDERGTHAFFVTGDASLTHQVNQTWTAVLAYSHDVGRVGVLAAPFVTDVVSGSLNGLWTRYVASTRPRVHARRRGARRAERVYGGERERPHQRPLHTIPPRVSRVCLLLLPVRPVDRARAGVSAAGEQAGASLPACRIPSR